ncbi:uncharacterized protein [Procambarus clarkii]|uniref:uncharacterized protein n=1 Tax=Procambarus clarkii TaxID=6728 RepID=UPI001E670ACB|nr:uncharacterized protein LOC123759110 [Procambarus clarkii]
MEFASQEAVYQPTRDHIHVLADLLPSTSTFDYLTNYNLYLLATFLIVATAIYTNYFSSIGTRPEKSLADFGQVVQDLDKKGVLSWIKKSPEKNAACASKLVVSDVSGAEHASVDTDGVLERKRMEFKGTLFESEDWIRPLGKLEVLIVTGGYYGSMNTIQTLWLSSSQPILPEMVRQAITTVAQRTEVLQLCVRRRWFWPWFCRRTHVRVPFKVEHGDVMTIYYKLLHSPYNMARGPLWRARLVPLPKTNVARHEAVLMFTIHHCATDAFTNMLVARETLKVLNSAMVGQVYQPPPRAFTPFICDDLVTKAHWYHALKFAVYKLCSPTVGNFNKHVYFNGTIPQPKCTLSSTKVLHEELCVKDTQNLLKYCKEAGVTVHSCIMTAANLAVFHSAQQRSDVELEPVTIRAMNCVNMRRYYPKEYREATGCHISVEEQELTISGSDGNSKESFWSLAKRSHLSLQQSLLVDKDPIRNTLGLLPCALLIPLNHWLARFNCKNLNDSHLISTNMGDLRDILPGRYDGPVEITKILRCSSDELTGHPYTLIFHTFRDRFCVTLEYYTNKIADEDAARYFSILTNYISDLANHGSVDISKDRKI